MIQSLNLGQSLIQSLYQYPVIRSQLHSLHRSLSGPSLLARAWLALDREKIGPTVGLRAINVTNEESMIGPLGQELLECVAGLYCQFEINFK